MGYMLQQPEVVLGWAVTITNSHMGKVGESQVACYVFLTQCTKNVLHHLSEKQVSNSDTRI